MVESDGELGFRDEWGNLQRQHVECVHSHLIQRQIDHLVELLRRVRLAVALVRVDLLLRAPEIRTFEEITIELRSIWSAINRPWSMPWGWMKPAGLLRVNKLQCNIPLKVLVEKLLTNRDLSHALQTKPHLNQVATKSACALHFATPVVVVNATTPTTVSQGTHLPPRPASLRSNIKKPTLEPHSPSASSNSGISRVLSSPPSPHP